VVVDVMPKAKTLLNLLFTIMFIFAAAGLELFGGLINKDPLSVYSSMLADDYQDSVTELLLTNINVGT
jgi:hypothetical protein